MAGGLRWLVTIQYALLQQSVLRLSILYHPEVYAKHQEALGYTDFNSNTAYYAANSQEQRDLTTKLKEASNSRTLSSTSSAASSSCLSSLGVADTLKDPPENSAEEL